MCADKHTDTEHDGVDSLQSRIPSSLCTMHPCPANATPTHCERIIIMLLMCACRRHGAGHAACNAAEQDPPHPRHFAVGQAGWDVEQ